MKIDLYSVSQKENTANKIKGLSPVYSGDISPYNGVTSSGATFILEKAYNANYGRFTFNGHTFYCNVSVAVTTDGLFIYKFTTDELATVYYNGDLHTTQHVVREINGDDKLIDTEIEKQDVVNITQWEMTGAEKNGVCYVINVLNAGATGDTITDINARYNVSATAKVTTIPNISTYILTPAGFRFFYSELMRDGKTAQYMQSILSIYVTDYSETIGGFVSSHYTDVTSTDGILLTRGGGTVDSVFDDGIVTKRIIDSGSTGLFYRVNMTDGLAGVSWNRQFETPVQINGGDLDDVFIIDVRHCGTLQFTPQEFNVDEIHTVGYRKLFDYVSGNVRVELVLNGTPQPSKFFNCQLSELTPLLSNESTSNFFSIASTVAGVGLAAYTGGTSAAVGAAASGVLATASGEYNASTSVSGSMGGDIYRSNNKSTIIYRYHRPSTNINDYQARFGKPSNRFRMLDTLTGYIRTDKCELQSTLPLEIVKSAESICDNGFYIV